MMHLSLEIQRDRMAAARADGAKDAMIGLQAAVDQARIEGRREAIEFMENKALRLSRGLVTSKATDAIFSDRDTARRASLQLRSLTSAARSELLT